MTHVDLIEKLLRYRKLQELPFLSNKICLDITLLRETVRSCNDVLRRLLFFLFWRFSGKHHITIVLIQEINRIALYPKILASRLKILNRKGRTIRE